MKNNLFDDYPLEEKLFIHMLFFLTLFSGISIIGNIIVGFSFIVNYKWIVLIFLSLWAYRYALKKKYVKFFQITILVLIIFVFLPSGWITSGGLNKLTIAHLFLICVSICFIFQGRLRLFFILSEILVLLILIYLESHYPTLIYHNSEEKQSMDIFIQMPLTLLATAYIVSVFSNGYRNEREKLKEYSQLLKERNEKLMEISRTDELTGTYNRRYLFERLNKLKDLMVESNNTIMIIMIDIDNFKFINDNYGHVIGDQILKRVSDTLVATIHEKGFVGRYGGDEFVIVLENRCVEEAKEIVQRMKRALEQMDDHDGISISISGGMAQLTGDDDIDDVLANADKLLYKVKNTSKNDILFENHL